MSPDGRSANDKSETDALTKPTANGDDHAPSVAAIRLAQEASELTRTPVVNAVHGVRDVTREFIAASEQLPPGELVKDEYFTLFEAVGALEIMDPKMDSGYVPPGDLFEPDFDASSGLAADEVLWVIQELVRFEMTFHDGYPLSQNIFTSLHVFNLISPGNKYPYQIQVRGSPRRPLGEDVAYDLVHIVLRAYCIALLKCVQVTLQLIQSHTFYEEEDFVTFLYGRELLPRLGTYEAQRLLTEAIGWVEGASIDSKLKDALTSHLELRQSALRCMDGEDEQWSQLKSAIEDVERQLELSKPIPAAFSDKVQRQMATSTPPRPMPTLSWQDACSRWKQLCDDIQAATRLTSYSIRKSPHSLQNATWAFAYREPAPNTYARAKMQDILITNDTFGEDFMHFDHLLSDIRELVLAGDSLADPAAFQVEVPSDPRHVCSRLMEDFMSRAIGEYLNLFRMLCQNRCRMRRTFTQAIPLLDEIESEAQAADERINEAIVPRKLKDAAGTEHQLEPMTLWSRYYKLQMAQWIIQLGFETDIYLPDELGNMYMLLIDFMDRQRQEIGRIEFFAKDRLSRLSRAVVDRAQQQECRASVDWLRSLMVAADTNLALASALAHLYAALEDLGVIDAPSAPFSDPEFRYEARMKPLLTMSNDAAPSMELLQQQKQQLSGTTIDQTARMVKGLVAKAKMSIAELKSMKPEQVKHVGTEDVWRAHLKRLETVCVAITVTVTELARIAEKHSQANAAGGRLQHAVEVVIAAPGKRYHDWWVVPQLKEKSIA